MPYEPGAPVPKDVIPLAVPEVGGNEWAYIKECLDTNWVSSVGPFVDRFEGLVAKRAGARHAVATASGTAALHLALLVAGVKPNDEVITSTLTFIAPANAIRYAGAWPVWMDAEPAYWQIDVEKVADFLRQECERVGDGLRNRRTGRRVAAIVPVHILGHPADMGPFVALAQQYGLPLISDAAECIGASYKSRPVGSVGDITCFSFNGNKIITTGGGGMLVTDNEAWARKARYLATQAKDDPLEYVHNEVGYNYRLTNIQAAMGVAQLERLDEFIERKRHIAEVYTDALGNIPGAGAGVTPMREAPWASSTFWLYTALFNVTAFGAGSRDVLRHLEKAGIQARPLWQPMHRSKAHEGCQAYRIEVADRLHEQGLSLPCSTGLTPAQQTRVIDAVATVARTV